LLVSFEVNKESMRRMEPPLSDLLCHSLLLWQEQHKHN